MSTLGKSLIGGIITAVDERRWDIRFTVKRTDGTEVEVVASADTYFTDRDRVFFDTYDEWENARDS